MRHFTGLDTHGDMIFPNTLTNIGKNVFYASSIASFTSEGELNIGDRAFINSAHMLAVNIPNVISIGSYSFGNCYRSFRN